MARVVCARAPNSVSSGRLFRRNLLLLSLGVLLQLSHSNADLFSCDLDATGHVCTLRRRDASVDTRVAPDSRGLPLLELRLARHRLTNAAFEALVQLLPPATVLDASHNNISALSGESFVQTPQLRELYLSRNQLQALTKACFRHLQQLRVLDVSRNRIQTIAERTFQSLKSLQFLHVHHNEIAHLTIDLWNAVALREFDAGHNHLHSVTIRRQPSAGTTLNLAHNRLSGTYSCSSQLSELLLEGNAISVLLVHQNVVRLRANDNLIREFQIAPTVELQVVELANNSLTDLRNLTRMATLTELDLSGNNLAGRLQGDAFSNLTALTRLSLRNTNATITQGLFLGNIHLRALDVSQNLLGTFDLKTLQFLRSLETLRLDSNALTEVGSFEDVQGILPALASVGLSGNHFNSSYLQRTRDTFAAASVEVLYSTDSTQDGGTPATPLLGVILLAGVLLLSAVVVTLLIDRYRSQGSLEIKQRPHWEDMREL